MTEKGRDPKEIFSAIALEHFRALRRFALSLCKDDFDADDLVSETILKGYQKFSTLKNVDKAKPWLFSILHNQYINDQRYRKHFVQLENESAKSDEEPFSLFESLSKSDYVSEGNPETGYVKSLTYKEVEAAIDQLPAEYKTAFILCDMEDFSYAEIASMLSVPIGTVRSRIARARSILQKQLWHQAKAMGIKISKKPKNNPEYTCTCGKEEETAHVHSEKVK
jgi:RNA polymerase sigma-70 factor (ECF subfamily)